MKCKLGLICAMMAISTYTFAQEETFSTPEDCTGKITNNSFESGLWGWTNKGMQQMNNNEAASGKVGKIYAEQWTQAPSSLNNVSISQNITGLENGEYLVTAICHAENQSTHVTPQGVYLFAGFGQTEVSTTATYEVKATVANGHLNIGFKTEGTNCNWVTVDHFQLQRTGISAKGYAQYLKNACDELSATVKKVEWLSEDLKKEANSLISSASTTSDTNKILELIKKVEQLNDQCRNYRIPVVRNEDNYVSYLFVYFPSNSDENLYYALSEDGYNYTPLNNGKRVMSSDTVAIKKGIRDPHILRGQDGKTFYMVATDMRCSEGWSSNRGMVLYKSTDLIHWQHSTIHFPDRFPEWKNVTRVWAPETIWDPEHVNEDGSKGAYMIYYSLLTNDGKCSYDKVFYSYANADFTDISDPVYLYDRGSATIDADIIFDETDNLYHMIYKNEGSGGICHITAKTLTAPEGAEPGSQWGKPSGTIQQTSVAVEGGGLFRLIGTNKWVVMYDCYTSGYYQFCSTENWEDYTLVAQTTTSGAFTPRHGTVIMLTREETAAILKAFPTSGYVPTSIDAASLTNGTKNCFKALEDGKIVIVNGDRKLSVAGF